MPFHAHLPVPDVTEYRKLLLELCITYLIKQPPNHLDFALDFFLEKKSQRMEEDENEDILEDFGNIGNSIYGGYLASEDFEDLPFFPKSNKAKNKLRKCLSEMFLFNHLNNKQIEQILNSMEEKVCAEGELIIKKGDAGDYFYVIDKGIFQAFDILPDGRTVIVRTYDNVGFFGQLALMYNKPRAFNVRAVTSGKLYALNGNIFKKIVEGIERRKRDLLASLILLVPIFSELSQNECEAVVDNLDERFYNPGEAIFEEGDDADGMHFVFEGNVICTKKEDVDNEEVFRSMSSSVLYMGDTSLVMHTPRTRTYRALTEVYTAFLSIEKFERLFRPYLEAMRKRGDFDFTLKETYPQNLRLHIRSSLDAQNE